MRHTQMYLFLVLLIFSSCGVNKQLEGLWQIEKVEVGNQEMTPIAKWARLNKDQTHESGNGWNQHSIGSWNYNSKENKIMISNENGLEDAFGGFTIKQLSQEKMTWWRVEEGEEVTVHLNKINNIPSSPANTLLGVWKLNSNPKEVSNENISYLFLRWDNILVSRQENEGRRYAAYKTHGHKNEVEFIYYEDPLRLERWEYSFDGKNTLLLSKNDEGKITELRYERINYLPG